MEQLYKDPRTPLRMRVGPFGAYVDEFADRLIEQGYARASVRYALQLVADFGRWLRRCKMIALRLTPEHLSRYGSTGAAEGTTGRATPQSCGGCSRCSSSAA